MTTPPKPAVTPLLGVNRNLLLALIIALAYHGVLIFFTFKRTYDAYVHIFFADHYARAWFDHWDYRWYTGFTMTSYPPGSQQSIALLSSYVGLQNGFIVVQTLAVLLVILGVYRFSRLWVSEEAAGYGALLAVFASSITETVHVFGQLPTMFSLGFLLNSLPFVYRWLKARDGRALRAAWLLTAATTAGHHVTTLFGAIFFVTPVIVLAIVEALRTPLLDEAPAQPQRVTRRNWRPLVLRRLRRIAPPVGRAALYGVGLLSALVFVVLPYWLWSRSDPITQVPIPHASRDSFIQNLNAGLVFFVIPYGLALLAIPYAFYKGLTTRAWPLALFMAVLMFLGTGGTTPFPRLLLGGAYQVLTLDRFTFWATILLLPLLGECVVSLSHGGLAKYLREQLGERPRRALLAVLLVAYIVFSIFTANLTQFRRFQPDPIDMQPIVNFLEKDQHGRWRYMTLGFGDQMAWLSAQTTATSPDGNYHSARRLPELTTTPVERLEGAKFRGIPGIGSLQQFLAVPEKYNLKYIFSNDQFYDPLLFFSGWHRLQRLENGIMVWEREDIPPLPEVLPRREIPVWQRALWGIVPMSAIFAALLTLAAPLWGPWLARLAGFLGITAFLSRLGAFPVARRLEILWGRFDNWLRDASQIEPSGENTPLRPWQVWAMWMRRLPRPLPAPPGVRAVRLALLLALAAAALVYGISAYLKQARDPASVVAAYYDDLDFRRFDQAYARLDPATRPTYDQYRLQLSVTDGLVASYGKLDSVRVRTLTSEPARVEVEAATNWVTALAEYPTLQRHTVVRRDGVWYVEPATGAIAIPPDQFVRRPVVTYRLQGRRRVTTETTSFNDVLDRPELQLLSARLVHTGGRYSVVGEVLNLDVDPADMTVTSFLFDAAGQPLTWYNAQDVMMHKLLPKEATPFRIDFEGVAGAALEDGATPVDFKPGAVTPVRLVRPLSAFDVYAKAVVTGRDLKRDVTAQDIRVELGANGRLHVRGNLFNTGTEDAVVPQVLVTLYDDQGRVVWVDHTYVEQAVSPQRAQAFDVPLTPRDDITVVLEKGDLYANLLGSAAPRGDAWQERIPLPPSSGYAGLRISVNYLPRPQS